MPESNPLQVADAVAFYISSLSTQVDVGRVVSQDEYARDNYRLAKLAYRANDKLIGILVEPHSFSETPEGGEEGDSPFNRERLNITIRITRAYNDGIGETYTSKRELWLLIIAIQELFRESNNFGLDESYVTHGYLKMPNGLQYDTFQDLGTCHIADCSAEFHLKHLVGPCD